MVRVAFTVALMVAVLAASAPAIEAVAVHRGDTSARAAVDRLTAAARSLASGEPALPADAGPPRRTVTIELPHGGFASAPLRSFTVGPPSNDTTRAATRFTWRVAGGHRHTVIADGIRIRPRGPAATNVAGGGSITFTLRLVSRRGRTVVRLGRANHKTCAIPGKMSPRWQSAGRRGASSPV